jgi:hypothetical protein
MDASVTGWCVLAPAAARHYKDAMKPVIEMRTYKIRSGQRAQFLEIFARRSVPAHQEIGMRILGPFLSVEDPDVFFFMRAFPDLSVRDRMKSAFYEGPLWTQELEQLLMPMIDKYDAVLVEDTAGLFEPWE